MHREQENILHIIEKSRETVEQLLARRNVPKTYEEKCQYALDLVDMHLHEENEHPIPVFCGHRRHLRYGIGNVLINEESDDDDFWNKIVQQRELLRREIDSVKADPGDVVSRPIKAVHDAGPNGIPAPFTKTMGIVVVAALAANAAASV